VTDVDLDRVAAETPVLKATFTDVNVDLRSRTVILPQYPLGPGWSLDATDVLVEIREGYPTVPPDNICVDPALRLASGALPGSVMGEREFNGRVWMQFSYHLDPGDWNPHPDLAQSDTLVTYLVGALTRLEDPS
jgi:hypothetical protein